MSRMIAVKNTSPPLRTSLTVSSTGNSAAVLADRGQFVADADDRARRLEATDIAMPRTLRLGHQHREVGADDFLRRVAEDALCAGLHCRMRPSLVDRDDRVDDGVEDRLEPGAAALGLLLERRGGQSRR